VQFTHDCDRQLDENKNENENENEKEDGFMIKRGEGN
jgi:hypothetical protein